VALRHKFLFGAVGAASLLVVGAIVGATVLLSGLMDTAATKQHLRITYWILEQGLRYSVRRHAEDIPVPDLEAAGRLEQGIACYRLNCEQCHGGPGIAPHDLAKGQLPLANNLAQTAREWTAGELYWVTKKGIRMSGMPAWEFRMSDESLWSLVAFVEHLPSLTAEGYDALAARAREQTCARDASVPASADPQRGIVALRQYGCTSCHVIPGVVGPDAFTGPPLTRLAKRAYLSGSLPNTPANLVRWIRDPRSVDPETLMPDLDVTEAHARDMAAYLGTLE
jgi:mono/diheme cytochrome c family protein